MRVDNGGIVVCRFIHEFFSVDMFLEFIGFIRLTGPSARLFLRVKGMVDVFWGT